MSTILIIFTGLMAGGFAVWMLKRGEAVSLKQRLADLETRNNQLSEDLSAEKTLRVRAETNLEAECRMSAEKLALIEAKGEDLRNAFKALSLEALRNNNQQFLDLAKTTLEKFQSEARSDLEKKEKAVENLVKPLAENLTKYEIHVREMEDKRGQAYGMLTEQVRALLESQKELKKETGKLADAFRRPEIRGRWGEIQLRNTVELAGMLEYCDFFEQQSASTETGVQRPDLVVRLPGGRNIAVDAKTPINAYIDSLDLSDEKAREEMLVSFARNVKDQIRNLGKKEYWKQFADSPDLVVLFLPGEVFYSTALRVDPSLIEEGIANRVVLAAPTTLIVLLRVVAMGWREERLAENARRISDLGKEVYTRIVTLTEHFSNLGRALNRSVDSYNQAVGSLESRVLVSARKFADLGAGSERSIEDIEPLDIQARRLNAPERSKGEAPVS
ncbi:MAG: DNA recombination protein RmuC [Candidatus Latescibacter sp.]|nr:DNA recombination protein RmuC [Candidatus Latescibacter sp.]